MIPSSLRTYYPSLTQDTRLCTGGGVGVGTQDLGGGNARPLGKESWLEVVGRETD